MATARLTASLPQCISNRNLSNPAKRKQEQGFLLPRASKNKSGASGAKKPRKRLNLGEKLEEDKRSLTNTGGRAGGGERLRVQGVGG